MAAEVGYISLFRGNRNFRLLFFARLVSMFGDWFNLIALLVLLRSIGGTSASDFGWLLILKMLPGLVVAPVAGVICDRYSRRMVMIVSDVVRAILVLGMISLAWFPSVVMLYTLVVLQSASSCFFEPARSAMLPDIVTPQELTAANAIGAATWSAMLALGSAVGGLVTAYLGWQAALWVDLASYLLSIWLLLRLQEPAWERKVSARQGLLGWLGIYEIVEGLRYVWQRPRVLSLLLVKPGWCMAGAVVLLLTLLGETTFLTAGIPVLGVTVLYFARGLGTGTGPFVARWLSRSEPAAMERMILFGYLSGSVFYMMLPWAGTLWLTACFVFLAHLGGATIWVFSSVRLQQIVPTEVRGRVFAAEFAGFTLSIASSIFVYGSLADAKVAGPQALLRIIGISLLIPAALWLWRGRRYGWAQGDEEATTA